jgi:hypothetical protein
VTFTPTDTADYTTATGNSQLTVNQAVPSITWAAPAAITYGTTLSSAQLDATMSVPGTCVYSPAAASTPKAGTETLSATCTPTDATDYTTATANVLLVVNQAVPTITWPTPAAIPYPTALSSTQLDATASVPGTFAYNPIAGTVLAVGTKTLSATFTPTDTTDYTTATANVQIVVNAPAVTNVSVSCTPSSISDVQTTACTPTVVGTGAFTNTVNLSVSPASAGTLSATSGVSSGTAVTFTPAFAGAATPTLIAVSTADSTKSGSAMVTVTLRTVTINSATGNIWLPDCFGLFVYNATQTGIVVGDTFHVDPYQPATVSSALPATFPVSLGIGNSGGINTCSPGAYSEYVTGTDGAVSNTHYVPIVDRWNAWAGYNTTDEFQADFATGSTCGYSLSNGAQDGSCLPNAAQMTIVDGSNLGTC